MAEAVTRRMVTEESPELGESCRWCGVRLGQGKEAATCSECGALHDGPCWDRELGCANEACINRPLARLDDRARKQGPPEGGFGRPQVTARPGETPVPPGYTRCPTCRGAMTLDQQVCDVCGAVNTPSGIYTGPKTTHPKAREALWLAIVGIFICQPILGGLAISRASEAKRAAATDPRVGGQGMATAGLIIGILDLILFVFATVSRLGKMTP